jgi:flagellar secretion chaperone FliS
MFHNFSGSDSHNPNFGSNYGPNFGPNFAGHQYHQVNAVSRVAGASPYQLVTILFEDVLLALKNAEQAAKQGHAAMLNDQRYRALSILIALEASLDFRAGGDLAVSLARVYREASRLLRTIDVGADAGAAQANIRAAHAMIAELAEAWFAIGGSQ